MNTKQATSMTLNKANLEFINDIAKKEKKTKSEIVDRVLDAYRKYKLKNNISAGFKEQTKEDINETMSDFGDYLKMVDR